MISNACVLSNLSVILSDDAGGILEAIKIHLVCFKLLLPALEHWNIGFPYHVGKFLVFVELKHNSIDKLHDYNNVLVMLSGFIFAISSYLGDKTLSALSMKDCELTLRFLLQHFLHVNNILF